jgi:hypothetical protein
MIKEIKLLFAKYRQAGILIDTNILLLYIVGLTNRERVSKFKRTQQFTSEDFNLLSQILKSFQRIVTTPGILTEVNSLANQLGEPERSKCLQIFGREIGRFQEIYEPSQNISQLSDFQIFGLTDCNILHIAKESYLVLTDDLRLAATLQRKGIDTVNFNNVRFYRLD